MRRPRVTSALAASTVVVLTISAAASSAPKPRRGACEPAPRGATTLVGASAAPFAAKAAGPVSIDMRTVPGIAPSAPSSQVPAEMPSPSIARAKKLKAGGTACVPQSAPTVPGPPSLR